MLLVVILAALAALLIWQTEEAWIALDQWIHCLVFRDGMADETFSARCWRECEDSAEGSSSKRRWNRWVIFVDWLFRNPTHCRDAFHHELDRDQLPVGYRTPKS